MKTSETEIILSSIFVLSSLGSAVLTGYEHRDITSDPSLGCRWQGGSSAAMICTCRDAKEMNITKNSIPSFTTATIEINGCKSVRFGEGSIYDMWNLRRINLKNIGALHFERSSLAWYGYRDKNRYEERYDLSLPSLQIKIENSTIGRISELTFEGRINTVRFDNVLIENVDPFAFHALIQSQSVIMNNVELRNVREQPFKKFATENFEMNGVRAKLIPSRFLNNVTVYKSFKITNCHFDTVRPGGFIVTSPLKFEVSRTKIDQLEGEAFKVSLRGDAVFRENDFRAVNDGAFRGFARSPEATGEGTIVLDSNVFGKITRDSLSVGEDFRVKYTDMKLNQSCDCRSIDREIKDTGSYSEIKCLHDDKFVTVEDFKSNKCSIIQSYSTVIVIVGVVLTLCVIVGVVLVVYYRRVYLSKKYGSEKDSKKGNMSLIVPDGRTYRETELHVIVERADLLTTDL